MKPNPPYPLTVHNLRKALLVAPRGSIYIIEGPCIRLLHTGRRHKTPYYLTQTPSPEEEMVNAPRRGRGGGGSPP